LLEEGEELADLMKLPPDQLLLRWMNFHLKNSGSDKRVANWSGDVKDSVAYTIVLNQIAPAVCDKSALNQANMDQRAGTVIKNAEKIGVPQFIQPKDISSGNARLNLAFAAQIFNTNPGLEPLTDEEKAELAGMMEDDVGDSREERAFRMWMNTLGIPDFYINGLFEDCKDGLALLKVEDFVEPGVVDWTKVEMKPNNKFKKLTNCNVAVDTGKKMHFSLVGIGGNDIHDGNKKLVLALVWQLMRYHTIKFLSHLTMHGAQVTDEQIVEWANKKVADAGRPSSMKSFRDKSLATSHFFFDLLHAVTPDIINWDLVTAADNDEDKLLNAKYAISVARKIGCTIFLLPEDVVEVKDKMILTFVAAIMTVALQQGR
jgi:plastin-1